MSQFFPDAQHVHAIRRALWTDREFGRASVMVGAGMSRNATPLRPNRPHMPGWADLTAALIDRLHPPGSADAGRRDALRQQAVATSAALRLADEFAAAFGRTALDELVRETVPDGDFAPGELHRLLVELPWADVLTTNYDTLLERAAGAAHGQQYSVVRTPAELPATPRPRVVKLHGSLPSTRPFVLTEEDFRTYPRRAAAFVNLARQVALETVLCLIGFSGDDPNFLAWSGWVRDELGEHAPRVYLCGLLGLTTAQRSLLEGRGVVPIDLTPLFPADTPDPSSRHPRALEWLLRTLGEGRPYDPFDWPDPPDPPASVPGLPPLLPSHQVAPRSERWYPSSNAG